MRLFKWLLSLMTENISDSVTPPASAAGAASPAPTPAPLPETALPAAPASDAPAASVTGPVTPPPAASQETPPDVTDQAPPPPPKRHICRPQVDPRKPGVF